jgi:hypothetical protein
MARLIGQRLGLPVIELDAIAHSRPKWQDLEPDEFRRQVARRLADCPDGWVIDGNYSPVRDLFLADADTVLWFQLPWVTSFRRLFVRTVRRSITREPLWGVNYESWRLSFLSRDSVLLWSITHHRAHRRSVRASLSEARGRGTRVIVLRSRGAVRRFAARLPAAPVTGESATLATK